MSLAEELIAALKPLEVRARRLVLETPGVRATVPMVRGVWGAALHDLDPKAYAAVFEGSDRAPPAYVLRPSPPDPGESPALDWIVPGPGLDHDASLLRAWDVASGMGLGPGRRRFRIRGFRLLGPTGAGPLALHAPGRGWSLARATLGVPGDPGRAPCRLRFDAPLRILRRGALIEAPDLSDLVLAALRRLEAYLPEDAAPPRALRERALALARETPAKPWEGERLDLRRWSARQREEVELRGVRGALELPEGLGELHPLFAAARWLHLGKGTVMGLGEPTVEPLEASDLVQGRCGRRGAPSELA